MSGAVCVNKMKLRAVKSSEHNNEKGDGQDRGMYVLEIVVKPYHLQHTFLITITSVVVVLVFKFSCCLRLIYVLIF